MRPGVVQLQVDSGWDRPTAELVANRRHKEEGTIPTPTQLGEFKDSGSTSLTITTAPPGCESERAEAPITEMNLVQTMYASVAPLREEDGKEQRIKPGDTVGESGVRVRQTGACSVIGDARVFGLDQGLSRLTEHLGLIP